MEATFLFAERQLDEGLPCRSIHTWRASLIQGCLHRVHASCNDTWTASCQDQHLAEPVTYDEEKCGVQRKESVPLLTVRCW